MGQRQSHRGRHPEDARLFAAKWVPALRDAVADLSFLLSRGYSEKAALKVVGDHYQLALRQRRAILGGACSDTSLERRNAHRITAADLCGQSLTVDGYNALITAESALAGGVLLKGRDGCIRDLASIHGSYRKVEETLPAIAMIGMLLEKLHVGEVTWYFDAPVSNSGKLKALLGEEAARHDWPWAVRLANNLDKLLAASPSIVVTADGWILDRAARWVNLTARIASGIHPPPEVIDLGE